MMQQPFTRSLLAVAILSIYAPAFAEDAPATVELETVNVVGSAGKIDGLKFKSAQSNTVINAQTIAEKAPMLWKKNYVKHNAHKKKPNLAQESVGLKNKRKTALCQ